MKHRTPDGIAVKFGDTEIVGLGIEGKVRNVVNDASTAEVVIPNDLLKAAGPDYRATVEVSAMYGAEREVLFTGFVDRASPQGHRVCIQLVTQTQIMKETALGGLGISQVDARELMWALPVLGGYSEDKVTIEGWEPGPLEVFEVATAVDGVALDEAVTFGSVTLHPGGPVSSMADSMGPSELEERYASASVWALVLKTARTLYEAEAEGLKDIDLALDWLTVKAQYSGVNLPNRTPRAFRRDWTMSRVSRRNVVVTRGTGTGRQWLRATKDIPSRPDLTLDEMEDLTLPTLPPDLPAQVGEAISAWRRCAEERDPLAAVVALWESVEFYAAAAKTRKIFEKSELKALRKGATEGLKGEQLERVQNVLAMLNEPPLMVRLEAALEEDGVPFGEDETALLKKVRKVRNDFVHGRTRKVPSDADLRYAVAFVNRMLLYRIAKLNLPTSETLSDGDVSQSGDVTSLLGRLAREV